jgi:hypothetical protein
MSHYFKRTAHNWFAASGGTRPLHEQAYSRLCRSPHVYRHPPPAASHALCAMLYHHGSLHPTTSDRFEPYQRRTKSIPSPYQVHTKSVPSPSKPCLPTLPTHSIGIYFDILTPYGCCLSFSLGKRLSHKPPRFFYLIKN